MQIKILWSKICSAKKIWPKILSGKPTYSSLPPSTCWPESYSFPGWLTSLSLLIYQKLKAYHVWYTKIPAKNVCPVEEYQQKSLESWHASSTNNQIKAFVERYMSTRGNHEIKINYAHKSRCPILRAVCNYGDVVVRNPHGEKQVTLASWWSGIQTKQAVDRSPGKNREVKGAQKQRQNQLCAFSKNVMLDKFSAILHKPSVNTLKQSGVGIRTK